MHTQSRKPVVHGYATQVAARATEQRIFNQLFNQRETALNRGLAAVT